MKRTEREHRLFLGPFQPDLESEFLALIKKKKEGDPLAPMPVLVGSNLLGVYLRRFLVLSGLNHMNLRFLTFLDLARVLAAESMSREGLRPLPRFGDLVLLSSLAEKIEPAGYFGPIAARRGFQRALGATFRDLWEGGIEGIPGAEDRKISELAALYRSYRSLEGQGFYPEAELFFRAAREAHRFPEIFGCEELLIYGFYDFTQGQKKLLHACSAHLSLTAFMPWRETPAFAYASPVRDWYRKSGFRVQPIPSPLKRGPEPLAILQENLFRPPAKAKRGAEGEERIVSIVDAPGEAREVREIAREILRLAREEEIPFYEMAVLLRNFEDYAPLLQETFEALGIPVYLPGGMPISRSQAGKSVLLLLDLIGSGFPRNQVMEFLTFAPIEWGRFVRGEPSPSQWDLISREAGILAGRAEWEEKLSAWELVKKDDAEEGEEGLKSSAAEAESFRNFLKPFFADLENFPRRSAWRGMVDSAVALLEAYFREGEDRDAVCAALRELEALDALGQEVPVRQFQEILSEALEGKTLPPGRFQGGGVCVSDLMPTRGLSFRAVFIPGVVEKAFPAAVRQDPLLLDSERKRINENLGEQGGISLKGSRLREETLLFSLALNSARERLILSYPRLDPSSGRERVPSFFLLRVAEALHGGKIDYGRLEAIPEYRHIPLSSLGPEDARVAVDEQEFDLAQVGKSLRSGARGEISYLSVLFPVFARAEKLALRRWGFKSLTEYDGCMNSAEARRRLRERFALSGEILSPTQLETYASCPFDYFLSRVLGLRKLPSPEEIRRIQPMDRGKVAHDILHQSYREALNGGAGPLGPGNLEVYGKLMEGVAARVFREAEARGLTGPPMLWEIDKQELLEDLRTFLEREVEEGKGRSPCGLEFSFGYRGRSGEPIALVLGDGSSISFRGRIDRADSSPDGTSLRVVDYKTGKLNGKEDGFCGGTTLQLPLYLLAASRIWKDSVVEKSWAEYQSVSRKGGFKRLLFRGEGWKEKESTLKEILEIISRGIAAGNFFPFQEDRRDCGYCDFRIVCEYGVGVLFDKKKNDPRAADFIRMRGIE